MRGFRNLPVKGDEQVLDGCFAASATFGVLFARLRPVCRVFGIMFRSQNVQWFSS